MLCRLAFVAALAALTLPLSAQTTLYQTDFPDAAGWTIAGSCWNVDAQPGGISGGPSHSLPYSLNCNYPGGGGYAFCGNLNSADSPAIDLAASQGFPVTLRFWCAFDLEEDDCFYDTRNVRVSNNGFQSLLVNLCLRWADCGSPGVWHEHTIALDPAWGAVQVRFFFSEGDGLFCNQCFDGWYVDDVLVKAECPPSVPYCTAKVNSLGCTPTIFTTGTPSMSLSGPAFRVRAANVINEKPGIFIWSLGSASIPFGGGTLCIAPPVTRTPVQQSGGNPPPPDDCSGAYSYNFTPQAMQQAGLSVGDVVHCQYWSRDAGFPPPDNVGLTAGLRFVVCL